MIIGIDIDDVITNTSELIVEYAKKYFKSDDNKLINNILHANNVDNRLSSFYRKYLKEMQSKYILKDNAKEVIERLKNNGHKIIIITARGHLKGLSQIKTTKDYLKKHNIYFDKIIFKARDKKEACINHKLDIMIDDSIAILNSLKNINIKTILFSSISNQDNIENFITVSSWLELEKLIDIV